MARYRKNDAGERRTAFVGFQVAPSERAVLDRRAARVGHSLSDFCRAVLLSDLKEPAPSARDPDAIRALAVEISRVGNNLNQLARLSNERKAAPQEAELREVAAKLKAALQRVTAL